MGASKKGPFDERVKTDLRISGRTNEVVEELSRKIGIPKNAFYTMAACSFAARLLPLVQGARKRDQMRLIVEKTFQKILDDTRKSA